MGNHSRLHGQRYVDAMLRNGFDDIETLSDMREDGCNKCVADVDIVSSAGTDS